jgi:Icc-related predicted phosphoesterase
MTSEQIELFRMLVSEIHIKMYTQEEYREIIDEIYREIFIVGGGLSNE